MVQHGELAFGGLELKQTDLLLYAVVMLLCAWRQIVARNIIASCFIRHLS